MPSVYLETTIASYLAAQPSRDLIMAAHQQITHQWWLNARDRFDLYISDAVLNEIRGGDPDAAARRLAIVNGLPAPQTNDDVRKPGHENDRPLGLVGRARADLPDFAFAVAYQMDYLVTWNCRHIANGEVIRRLLDANAALHRPTPPVGAPGRNPPWLRGGGPRK